MLKAIQENAKDAPVVITGDFNAGMGEKPGRKRRWCSHTSRILTMFKNATR